ncbi:MULTISPECIES: tetratricopeptide repeat protein [Geobacter]|uniref:tetratricopeptide repeat protein n=1 Tax=Geobacter TaxID=28231 RepID=UPI0025738206|nr:tetratricopeptide repeat protein [Geobacter sulfurreducens]BEH10323.1 tetratricopeptide repeat protein [Geobacter sulfurreducens subsp. ethanolicus]BET58089.1 tetratricopeptide repeat protein [Geobacter sp. 60473]
MSSKKDKHLDSAQKFLIKGQVDRAIREYEQAVTLDPKDVRVRQKYAELLVRASRKNEALREFEVIGKFYADNGFFLKAIAVYKQIQKIDPTNSGTSLTLATLNEKQGLVGNALAEYKAVYDFYEKSGQLREGVKVLERMHSLDRENITIRLKLADTRNKIGQTDEAYQEFTVLAREVRAKGDAAAYGRICERIGQLFPERREFLLMVAEDELAAGNHAAALPLLKQFAGDERFNPRALYLLADASRAAGDLKTASDTYNRIVLNYPGELAACKGLLFCLRHRGDVEEALELLKRFEPEFLSHEPETLEQFYLSLQEIAPHNEAIAEGLRTVRGTADKDVDVSGEQEQELASFYEDSVSLPDGSPAVTESPAAGAAEVDFDSDESLWEEEVEIGLEGDGDADLEEIELEVSVTDESIDWLAGPESEATSLTDDLSLDFTEDELNDLVPPPSSVSPSPGLNGGKYGLDGLFSAFKKGVGEQLDQGDTETHYNLGIAYKEMGLYDDAVTEFKAAAQDPRRLVDCITLQGICYRDKGEPARAEELFNSGLMLSELSPEEFLCLTYELALTLEQKGDVEKALAEYRKIADVDPAFRDTAGKLEHLGHDDLADADLVDLEETP